MTGLAIIFLFSAIPFTMRVTPWKGWSKIHEQNQTNDQYFIGHRHAPCPAVHGGAGSGTGNANGGLYQ